MVVTYGKIREDLHAILNIGWVVNLMPKTCNHLKSESKFRDCVILVSELTGSDRKRSCNCSESQSRLGKRGGIEWKMLVMKQSHDVAIQSPGN